jgi:hypothetical protein
MIGKRATLENRDMAWVHFSDIPFPDFQISQFPITQLPNCPITRFSVRSVAFVTPSGVQPSGAVRRGTAESTRSRCRCRDRECTVGERNGCAGNRAQPLVNWDSGRANWNSVTDSGHVATSIGHRATSSRDQAHRFSRWVRRPLPISSDTIEQCGSATTGPKDGLAATTTSTQSATHDRLAAALVAPQRSR